MKRNDLRPWRALAPTRLSGEIPPAGTAGFPKPHLLLPHPDPPPPLLSSPGRAVVSSSGHLCAPKRLPDVPQTSPRRLPDVSQTPSKPLPAVSQTAPGNLARLGLQGGGDPLPASHYIRWIQVRIKFKFWPSLSQNYRRSRQRPTIVMSLVPPGERHAAEHFSGEIEGGGTTVTTF